MSHLHRASPKRMYVEPRLPLYPANGRSCPLCHGSGNNCPECGFDDEPEDDSPLCECDLELTLEEIDRGRCAACGKDIL